jgi:hypothetical protein
LPAAHASNAPDAACTVFAHARGRRLPDTAHATADADAHATAYADAHATAYADAHATADAYAPATTSAAA